MNNDIRHGHMFALAAFGVWGTFPVFFKFLQGIPAWEILAHRISWSMLTLIIFLALTGKLWRTLRLTADLKQSKWLFVSASLIAVNWVTFIWAVNDGRILETSLGYFFTPIINILIGLALFREKLRRGQWMAVTLACIGVGYQVIELGHLPWVSLSLALSFGLYGAIRKRTTVNSIDGLAIETLLLCPISLGYLAWLWSQNTLSLSLETPAKDALLAITGLVTILPLIWFASAAKRLPMTTIAFWQYMTPTITMQLAIWVYNEPFDEKRLIPFLLIWSALVIFSIDSLRSARKIRRMAMVAPLKEQPAK
ncbi:EamA family transporter RarD [Pokkaliibacter sp. CJK22405]|uniref:EamA family transporter RarD n=1 Tax=Pokkaliibacter sp. CJK22405 TaxID=3384615 RepID=UPI003984B547